MTSSMQLGLEDREPKSNNHGLDRVTFVFVNVLLKARLTPVGTGALKTFFLSSLHADVFPKLQAAAGHQFSKNR
jgi:hypothetical protein